MIKLTVTQIKYAIDHCNEIAEQQHYTDEMAKADHESGFYYDDALEYKGFFIIPAGDKPQDIDFDYGDTNSDGEVLNQTDPIAPIPDLTENLRADLERLFKRKKRICCKPNLNLKGVFFMEFSVPVAYEMWGRVTVYAKDERDLAKKLKLKNFISEMPLSDDPDYVDNSYEIDTDYINGSPSVIESATGGFKQGPNIHLTDEELKAIDNPTWGDVNETDES